MGLNDFKTSPSNSSAKSRTNGSSNSTVQSVEYSSDTPHFNAVLCKESGEAKCFTGEETFGDTCRFADEVYLTSIINEEEYDRVNRIARHVHGHTLEQLFKIDPVKAADFVDRLNPNKPGEEKCTCGVCGEPILITEDKYTKVDCHIVHTKHTVEQVVEELEL